MFAGVLGVTVAFFAIGAALLAVQQRRGQVGTTWRKYAVYLLFVLAMLALARLGAVVFVAAIFGIIVVALVEFARAGGLGWRLLAGLVVATAVAGAAALGEDPTALYAVAWLGSVGFLVAGAVARSPREVMPRAVWAVTGFLAIGVGGAHLLLFAAGEARFEAFALLFLAVCGGDAFAELVGRLWPLGRGYAAASPGKTVSGAVAGLGAAVALGIAVSAVTGFRSVPVAAVVALAAGVAGMLGDLVASAWKRAFGIKDFAALLPGHGGVLDRVDSLLLAAPPFYWLLRI